MDLDLVWKLLLAWLVLALVIFAIAQEWTVFLFTVSLSILGGLIYLRQDLISHKLPKKSFTWFIIIAVVVTILEESFCYSLGCTMADPNLLIDLYIVVPLWIIWFSSWWFWMARHYSFTHKEALLLAGFNGFMYEYVGTGTIFRDLFGWVIAYPVISIVYSSIFVLPMLMIKFTGKRKNWKSYVIAALLPFVLSIPAAVILGLIRVLVGF